MTSERTVCSPRNAQEISNACALAKEAILVALLEVLGEVLVGEEAFVAEFAAEGRDQKDPSSFFEREEGFLHRVYSHFVGNPHAPRERLRLSTPRNKRRNVVLQEGVRIELMLVRKNLFVLDANLAAEEEVKGFAANRQARQTRQVNERYPEHVLIQTNERYGALRTKALTCGSFQHDSGGRASSMRCNRTSCRGN